MLVVLLIFRALGIFMAFLGVLFAFVMIASPFADQIIIPRFFLEWGLRPSNFSDNYILWILFFLIFISGFVLINWSIRKEQRSRIWLLAFGLLLIIGSSAGVCLFLEGSKILDAEDGDVFFLWVVLGMCYLIGLVGISINGRRIDEQEERERRELEDEDNLGDQDGL